MDIVLEAFDRYLFDYAYAKVLPISQQAYARYGFDLQLAAAPNTTVSSMRELPTAIEYQYQPASQFLHFEPSDYAYLSQWPRNNIYRQAISLYTITTLFGCFLYFFCATLSYFFVFDHETFKHPKFVRNQVRQEIWQSVQSMPVMALCTIPFFVFEVRGYSKMYDGSADGPGMWYNILQFPLFICFTDFVIYWVHRGLHHPLIYKRLHKAHHRWIMPSPYASHAFHPLDGYAQSLPYHIFPFLFPLQKFAYVALFIFINIWTVVIHDGEYVANSPVINGAACHTMHHLYFNYNYGQFTTFWDRMGGSYRKPNDELFRRETKMGPKEWERQKKEMEKIQKEVEGDDDRSYGGQMKAKKVQ